MENELKFIDLRAKGWSFDRIAREIDISKPTLIKWSRKHRVDIENQKQLELDSLRESLKLDRCARLKALGLVLEKLEKRIADADFDQIPLDKAIAAWTKLSEALLANGDAIVLEGDHDLIESMRRTTKWTG